MRVGVVGATGAVGEEISEILVERKWPIAEIHAFASARSAGRELDFAGQKVTVREAVPEEVAGCDLVFLSAGATSSRALRPALDAAGTPVADNTSAFRMAPEVPLVVPEINGHLVGPDTPYVAVPNCTTILLTLALAPLERAFGLDRVIVSTYQAVSGAGKRALEQLLDQTRAALSDRSEAPEGHPYAFNVIPSIGPAEALPGGGWSTGEESKVVAETRRILDRPDLDVVATCVRVPVVRAHSESVLVELKKPASVEEAAAALREAPGVEVIPTDDTVDVPTPLQSSGSDGIRVGRLRSVGSRGSLAFFLSGDQLRKGAALNAVQIAELHRSHLSPGPTGAA